MATLFGFHCRAVQRDVCTFGLRCLHHQVVKKCLSSTTKTTQVAYQLGRIKLDSGIVFRRIPKTVTSGETSFIRTFNNASFRQTRNGAFIPVMRHGNRMIGVRFMSKQGGSGDTSQTDTLLYVLSVLTLSGGLAYAGVPFFKMFCRQFGLGGNPDLSKGHDREKVSTMQKVEDREITVRFNADTHAAMKWNFKPQQSKIKVKPGETALAFYTAENPTDKPIVGISTYTVTPYIAAPYFNKIQCFCFEEQILNPHEQVDMPVFFYIDPEYDEDPQLEFEDNITLSYTFFEAKEGMSLPLPGFMQPTAQPGSQPA